jgi:hypothetical protein
MMPLFWQQFFEKNLGINGTIEIEKIPFEDCY